MSCSNQTFDPHLLKTIKTISYKSLLKQSNDNVQIPFYMDSKCKYKIRRGKQSLPFISKLSSRMSSLPNQAQISHTPTNNPKIKIQKKSENGQITTIHLQSKNSSKNSFLQENYFQRTRNSSFIENLLAQLKHPNNQRS